MIRGIGIDLCPISYMTDEKHRSLLMERWYSDIERAYVAARGEAAAQTAAGFFAAKEATLKALGTGLFGISLRDVEIRHNDLGVPILFLYGAAMERAEKLGARHGHLSITHAADMAAGVCILEG